MAIQHERAVNFDFHSGLHQGFGHLDVRGAEDRLEQLRENQRNIQEHGLLHAEPHEARELRIS